MDIPCFLARAGHFTPLVEKATLFQWALVILSVSLNGLLSREYAGSQEPKHLDNERRRATPLSGKRSASFPAE